MRWQYNLLAMQFVGNQQIGFPYAGSVCCGFLPKLAYIANTVKYVILFILVTLS